VYAEELVRLTRETNRTKSELESLKRKLEIKNNFLQDVRAQLVAVKSQLEKTEKARLQTIGEKSHLEEAFEETRQQLEELENHSSEVKQRLESKVDELERNLSAAETRESCFREVQRDTIEQLREGERECEAAKIKAETFRLAKEKAESSSAELEESRRSLQHQLELTQRDTCQQVRDVEHRAKHRQQAIEASLTETTKTCQGLQQQLKQVEQQKTEQAKTHEAKLDRSGQEVASLNQQLAIARLKLDQQEDYKKAHTEGW